MDEFSINHCDKWTFLSLKCLECRRRFHWKHSSRSSHPLHPSVVQSETTVASLWNMPIPACHTQSAFYNPFVFPLLKFLPFSLHTFACRLWSCWSFLRTQFLACCAPLDLNWPSVSLRGTCSFCLWDMKSPTAVLVDRRLDKEFELMNRVEFIYEVSDDLGWEIMWYMLHVTCTSLLNYYSLPYKIFTDYDFTQKISNG